DRDVADVDRSLLGDDATRLRATGRGLDAGVPGDPVDALDDDLLLGGGGPDDLPPRSPGPAGDELGPVALLDLPTGHGLKHLRRQRNNLHELLVPQLAADRPEDAGASRVATVADEHRGVLVEPDVGAVRPPALLGGAHHDRLDHVTALHAGAGQRV